MGALLRTHCFPKFIVFAFLCVILLDNNVAYASCASCNGNAEPSRTFGGLEAIIDTASLSINEMLQLAKQRVADLEGRYCEGKDNEIDSDISGVSPSKQKSLVRDCAEAYKNGHRKNGIYQIQPRFLNTVIEVYCDMTTLGGGWTVIQRRDADASHRQDFFLNWNEYKKGFGNLSQEFWLGNDYIFALTNQASTLLRIELEDFEKNSKFAEYTRFLVRSELEKYRMTIGKYHGDAGNGLADKDISHNNTAFSTKDEENDITLTEHCAQKYKGGWWYSKCHRANLNGLPHRGNHSSFADGINWHPWKGYNYSLKRAEMKIRPMTF